MSKPAIVKLLNVIKISIAGLRLITNRIEFSFIILVIGIFF